jgi:hypothetical protein
MVRVIVLLGESERNSSIWSEALENPRSMPSMRENNLPLLEEEVCQLRVPCCQDEEIRRLGQKSQSQKRRGHRQNELHERHPQKSQKRIQRRKDSQTHHQKSLMTYQ